MYRLHVMRRKERDEDQIILMRGEGRDGEKNGAGEISQLEERGK